MVFKMSEIAKPALDVVMNDEVKFHPEKIQNTYRHWMENIRDWNISRQLWWGQQIPAYYYGDGENDFVVAENIEEALKLSSKKNFNLRTSDFGLETRRRRSRYLVFFLVVANVSFDGGLNPENEDIKYYYPTSDLVTGPDIIFFWVARMIMAGLNFEVKFLSKNVYFFVQELYVINNVEKCRNHSEILLIQLN